jgi:hypothetical protein
MGAPEAVTLRHLVALARALQPVDRLLAHAVSHGAATRAVVATGSAQPLRSCPLDTRFVVREAAGSGAVGVVRTSAGEFLRRRVPGR